MTEENTINKQEITDIFKAAAKARNSAGCMLWRLISVCTFPQYYANTFITFECCKDFLNTNNCEISNYHDELENDLKFLQDIIVSTSDNEKCVYSIFRKDVDDYLISFQFPTWFTEALRTHPNPFQFCFEE